MPKYSVEIFRKYEANDSVAALIVVALMHDKLNEISLTWVESNDGSPCE
jgi:hypothetical protein